MRGSNRLCIAAQIGLILSLTLLPSCGKKAPEYDLIIADGLMVDGSGSPGYVADVGVKGDTIVRVGSLDEKARKSAALVINTSGKVVCPGFIDAHTHSDYSLLADGTAQSKIRQGVTTEIIGESSSAGPIKGKVHPGSPYGLTEDWQTLGGYFARIEKSGISVNLGSMVGATQVRSCILGEDSRDPTPEEMEQMKQLVDDAMKDGALGLSCALLVPPNTYLKTGQLIELASVVKPYGGIFQIHIRTEGEGILDAIREAIEIGEKAGVPVDILHLKVADKRLWGQMKDVCDLIESARARGLKVTANQYPYIAGQNNLVALVPPWAMEGGRAEMLKRLSQPALRARMERDINKGVPGWFNHYLAVGSWERCQVASVRSSENKKFEGKSIAEIAQMEGKKPTDAVFDLLIQEKGSVPAVYFLMSEDDVRYAMRMPWVSVGSDGSAIRPAGILGAGVPHPRYYGTFPRILGKYVREEHILTVEEAVRKMTYLNADKFGFSDRGLLKAGYKADITVFDPERVVDKATFQNPHQYPVGITDVIVNGTVVIRNGEHTGAKPGRVLRKYVAK